MHMVQVQPGLDVHILERSTPSFYFQSLVFSCVKWDSDVMLTSHRNAFSFIDEKFFIGLMYYIFSEKS